MNRERIKKISQLVLLWTGLNLLFSCLTSLSQEDPGSEESASLSGKTQSPKKPDPKPPGGKTLGKLPFPKKPTRHSTRVMLLAQPQPPSSQINGCIEQINSIGQNSQSQEEMIISRNQLVPLVESNLFLYHFCFFTLVAQLDQKLAEGGPVMTQQAPLFLETMRSLWIIASALDNVEEDEKYFTYLKKRYLQLSEEVFGRQLETIGAPMGNLRFDPDAPQLSPSAPSP